jgi:AraC family transcriptional activator of mtrCDE
MDSLSRLLQLYPVDVALDHACRLGAPWSLDNAATAYGIAPYHLVILGSAWLHVEGMQPVQLFNGDLVILPSGAAHTLSAHRELTAGQLRRENGGALPIVVNDGDGPRCEILCGEFNFDPLVAGSLFAALPTLLLVRATETDRLDSMVALIELLRTEYRRSELGSSMILRQLASALFAMIIRVWLAQSPSQPGMLSLLAEPRLRRGLDAMLGDPARQWSIDELAEECLLSRATFARHFAKVSGMTPGEMLMKIRMGQAAQWLLNDERNVAIIADAVGYQSEAAFIRAFSRFHGSTPGAYRSHKKQKSRGIDLPASNN